MTVCSTTLWVGHLSKLVQEDDLSDNFGTYGEVIVGQILNRVAGLGRFSAGANMAMKPFVKRIITIFATNASFLRVISNFLI